MSDAYTQYLTERLELLESQIGSVHTPDYRALENAIEPVKAKLAEIEKLAKSKTITQADLNAVAAAARKSVIDMRDALIEGFAENINASEAELKQSLDAKIDRTIGASAADAATAKLAATSILKAMADSLLLNIETTAYGERK